MRFSSGFHLVAQWFSHRSKGTAQRVGSHYGVTPELSIPAARATDINLQRSVAIKVLPTSVAGDTESLARLPREAEARGPQQSEHRPV